MTGTTPNETPESEDQNETPPSSPDADDATTPPPASPTADEPSIWDNPPESPLPEGYYTQDGTPTFDAVRARIEERAATADGHTELDSELPRERDFRKEQEELKKAGADRLEQLRKSMGLDK